MPWFDNDDESIFISGLAPGNNTTYWGRVTAGVTGDITTIRSKFTGVGAPFGVRLAVYSDSGNRPNNLLGSALDSTIGAPLVDTILELNLVSSVFVTQGQNVWIGVQAENPGALRTEPLSSLDTNIRTDIGWTGGFPDPANAPTTDTNATMAGIFIVPFIDPDDDGLPFGTVFVTDGTERIDLNRCGRFWISDWVPSVPGPKGNGTWRQSSLAPGRQLVDWQWENWTEVFTIGMSNSNQDKLIRQEQDLQRLLIKAHQYWTTDWQSEPVWLEVRAPCETNTRYAVIKSWRTPRGSGNPFQQPFSPVGQQKSVIDNFQLTVEHGPWLSDQPGTGRCVAISGTQDAYPFHLEFNGNNGDTSYVDCTNNGALQDLPTSNFTVEGWVRADGWGQNNDGVIFSKAAAVTTGWHLRIDSSDGVRAFADYSGNDAISTTGIDDFLADGEWHHIAATFDPVTDEWRIWIDGTEASYTLQQAGTVGYNTDAGIFLYMGNRFSGGNQISTWEGGIGWTRLSDSLRYTADFTVPPRCILPDIDGNTIAQWIGIENSGATIDNQEGTAALDGTQTDCEFDFDCEYGRTETCLEEVYIANKHNLAQLTHIFVDDGGVFGGNLIGAALPFLFLPAVPVANDVVYFGIDTTFDDSGPFCSLVFDILTAQTGITGIAWEYWNGAWVALGVQDNTDADGAMTGVAFDTTGVNSVHWSQPSDWATRAVNGVTGYWVRARVTAAAAATGPIQQNRDIYSILWPYIEVDEGQVLGDIEFSLRSIVRNQSDGATNIDSENRVLFGLRSVDRGEDYTPFINLSDEQNHSGITVSVAAEAAFQTDTRAPSGRSILWTPVVIGALNQRARVRFNSVLSPQYNGIFHVYLRISNGTGAAGNFDLQLRISSASGPITITETLTNQLTAATDFEVMDFGQIRLPGHDLPDGYIPDTLTIDIYGSAVAAGGNTLTLYDVILFPVDEWSADIVDPLTDPTVPSTSEISWNEYLDLDNTTYPKSTLSFIRESDNDIKTRYNQILAAKPLLQANQTQRLWFMVHGIASTAAIIYDGDPESSHTIQLSGNARYLYARGDR